MANPLEAVEQRNPRFQELSPREQALSKGLFAYHCKGLQTTPLGEFTHEQRNSLIVNLFLLHLNGDFGMAARDLIAKDPNFGLRPE